MRDEAKQPVIKWNLTGAHLAKHAVPVLNAKDNEVAIEELTLSVERIDIDTKGVC